MWTKDGDIYGDRHRQQLPRHQLPHGRDAAAQAHRLHHLLHGGDRQGDLGDEARHQLQGTDLRRVVPQGVQEQGKLSAGPSRSGYSKQRCKLFKRNRILYVN